MGVEYENTLQNLECWTETITSPARSLPISTDWDFLGLRWSLSSQPLRLQQEGVDMWSAIQIQTEAWNLCARRGSAYAGPLVNNWALAGSLPNPDSRQLNAGTLVELFLAEGRCNPNLPSQ